MATGDQNNFSDSFNKILNDGIEQIAKGSAEFHKELQEEANRALNNDTETSETSDNQQVTLSIVCDRIPEKNITNTVQNLNTVAVKAHRENDDPNDFEKNPNNVRTLVKDTNSIIGDLSNFPAGEPSKKAQYVDDIFTIPKWSIEDFMNERVSWQKQEDILVGEKGWFYFKIFFRFDTGYGLLGNVLKDENNTKFATINSAAQYLYVISGGKSNGQAAAYKEAAKVRDKEIEDYAKKHHFNNIEDYKAMLERTNYLDNPLFPEELKPLNIPTSSKNTERYKAENVKSRLLLLQRFVKSLSYISSKAPWFFKKISNLQSFNVDFNDLSKEQFIEIECMEEAIDMRLGNLMDLYRTAAFDMYLQKEILPENLRKFDMSVMLFSLPVKYFQTASVSLTNGKFKYKNTYDDDMSKIMSFKLFTFVGCEFDLQSLNEYYAAEMNNESPFELGKSKIKIRYDRCYQHRMDEWNNILYGDNGVYFSANYKSDASIGKSLSDSPNITGTIGKNALADWKNRIAAIEYAIDNKYYFNRKSDIYKALIDASEGLIQNAMLTIDSGSILGNLYEQDFSKYSYTKDAINTVTSMFGKNINKHSAIGAILSEINDHVIHGNITGPYSESNEEDKRKQIHEMIDTVKGVPIKWEFPKYNENKPKIVQNGRDPNRIGKRLDNVGQANNTNNTNNSGSNNNYMFISNSSNRTDADKVITNGKKVKTVNEKIKQLRNKK